LGAVNLEHVRSPPANVILIVKIHTLIAAVTSPNNRIAKGERFARSPFLFYYSLVGNCTNASFMVDLC